MKRIVTALGAFFLLSGSALAADVSAPAYDWTGAYVGLQGGYLWSDSYAYDTFFGVLDAKAHPDFDGVFGGVYLGYNYQLQNKIVLGVDADLNVADASSGYKTATNAAGAPIPPNEIASQLDAFGSARLRLGLAAGRWLPYIAGGLAIADPTFKYNYAGGFKKSDETMVGWTLGAGLEYAMTDNLVARIEYRYTDYGKTGAQKFSAVFPNNVEHASLKTSDVRLGLSWKF